MTDKIRIATCSLGGCFGCHMSILDIDERIAELAEVVQFDRSPLTDIKTCGPCDLGLIEGGLCNEENVEVLIEFRKNCRILVAVGACAITGGIPAMRNNCELDSCIEEAFVRSPGLYNAQIPNDPELPLLLDKVRPIQDAVTVDFFLPGCPPSADVIWTVLQQILNGQPLVIPAQELRFD